MRTNEELKLLLESMIPENIKQNHTLFHNLFQIFFEYISDAYMLGSNPNLIIEPDEKLWSSDYSALYNTDLTDVKKELLSTYLYDFSKFIDAMVNDKEIYDYFNGVYDNTALKNKFTLDFLMKKIDADEFLNHKKVSQQKTIPVLFNYVMHFINKMEVPNIHGVDTFLEMYQGTPSNPKKPFSYTINSSVPRVVYDNAVSPRVHPVGFSNDYKYEARWELQDFVNLTVNYEDWKVYTITKGKENNFFNYKIKTRKIPHCQLTNSGTEIVSLFDVDYENTVSSYGLNIIDEAYTGDGQQLVRVSENEYKLLTDEKTMYNSAMNGVKLVDSVNGSYENYNEEEFNKANNISAHGGMIGANGTILIDGVVVPGVKVYNNIVLVLKDEGTPNERWEPDNNFEIVDGFIFRMSIKDLYSSQAARFDERSDFIIVKPKNDETIFTQTGSHSFFVTFTDLSEAKYIWSTNDRSSALKHSFAVKNDRVIIYERGGKVLEGYKQFSPNTKYHIVVQWDSSGRKVFVDKEELFLVDKSIHYPEKLFLKTLNPSWNVDESFTFSLNYKTFSLTYNRAYEYTGSKTITSKVKFFKSGNKVENGVPLFGHYVLLESLSLLDDIQAVRTIIEENKILLREQKAQIFRDYQIKKQGYTEAEAAMELNRLNHMISQVEAQIPTLDSFNVMINNENFIFKNMVLEKDEYIIKGLFDNILDSTLSVFNEYPLDNDRSKFEFAPEVNQIVVGNTLFHYKEGVTRVSYILDNYDIFSRPLLAEEIEDLYNDHDFWVLSDSFPTDLEIKWSLDTAIWDGYHSELEFNKPTLWNIGETYTIGMANLLIQYYIASNSLGAKFDCTIDKYIDHPKALVDRSITANPDTVVWDEVEYVTENINAENELFIVAQLKDGTRLEYIKNKFLRHIRRFIVDKDNNEYPFESELDGKTVLEDVEGNRIFDLKQVRYIPYDIFNSNAEKIITLLPSFSGALDFNQKVEEAKISVMRPLVEMYGVYYLQDPGLVSNPTKRVIKIKSASAYSYNLTQIRDFENLTVYKSEVELHFLKYFDDINILDMIWDSNEDTLTFDEKLATIATDDNYVINIISNKYANISTDNIISKKILEPIEEQSLVEKNILLLKGTNVEVTRDEEIIESFPSSSFMDYSYKIRIEAFNKDEANYVLDWEMGEATMSLDEWEASKDILLCQRQKEGKIYLNMNHNSDNYIVPTPRIYDKLHNMNDDLFELDYGNTGLGGLIDNLDNLDIVILDFNKTTDLTKYKFSVGSMGKKREVVLNSFIDETGNNIPFNRDSSGRLYVEVEETAGNKIRYNKIKSTQINKFYMEGINRMYIPKQDEFKIRQLIGTTSTNYYCDVPYYRRKECLPETYVVTLAPTFLGYVSVLSPVTSSMLLHYVENYLENTVAVEEALNVDIHNRLFYFDTNGYTIYINDLDYVYYYDRSYRIPKGFNPADYSNQMFIIVDGLRETVLLDTLNNNYYYYETGSGNKTYLTDTDLDSVYFFIDAKNGDIINVPLKLSFTPDSNTTYYTLKGGRRIWKTNVTTEDGYYYYDTESGVSVKTRLTANQETEMYTMGGTGLKDVITNYSVSTPNTNQWFYFSDSSYNNLAGEHYRINLTTAEISTITSNKAIINVLQVDGTYLTKEVKVYLPKYYTNTLNQLVLVKENDYPNIKVQYDGSEMLSVTTMEPEPIEKYIKLVTTEQKEVKNYTTLPYYNNRFGDVTLLTFDDMADVYMYNGKYYINEPVVKHLRVYNDVNNVHLYYYLIGTQKYYVELSNFEYYNKSYFSKATKYLDLPYKTTRLTDTEVRELWYYETTPGDISTRRWLDESGEEYLSANLNSYAYLTKDGRVYRTTFDNLGRFYYDESFNKIYIANYDEYYKVNDVWYKISYDKDKTFLSREDILIFRANDIISLGCTLTGSTLYHNVF